MTDQYKITQKLRADLTGLLQSLPEDLRNSPKVTQLAEQADEKVFNIVHLTYHSQNTEGISKDFEFSRQAMDRHWRAGFEDTIESLDHPEILAPCKNEGMRIFDFTGRDH